MTMRAFVSDSGATANTSVRKITPEIADRWLSAMAYDHQRSVRKFHVEYLAEEMRRGDFRQFTPLQICSYNGQQLLLDGQHRLSAVVSSGIPQIFTVIETQSDSAEEVAWAYGNTDIGMKRTGNDLYSALDLSGKFDLTKTDIGALGAAIVFMGHGCLRVASREKPHRNDVVSRMATYAPYMREYTALVFGCDGSIRAAMRRAATLSVALLSLRYSKPRAELRGDPIVADFWRGVAFDDGIPIGDPRKVANRHLLTAGMNGGNSNTTSAIVTAAHSTRFIANCFNAYMSRKELKFTRVFDPTAPLALYGVSSDPAEWIKE